jgi:hypothetical protein
MAFHMRIRALWYMLCYTVGDLLVAFAPVNRDRDFFVKRASFGFFIFSKKKRERKLPPRLTEEHWP